MRVANVSLVVMACAPAFLIGTVHAPTMIVVAACAALYALEGARRCHQKQRPVGLTGIALACLLLGVLACLQLIPLPASLLSLLNPQATGAREPLSAWLSVTPGGASSLDPTRTALAALRWLTLGLAAMGASWWMTASRKWARGSSVLLAQAFAVMGVLQVSIGLGQTLLGTGGVVAGVWDSSRDTLALVSGTFVNGNHAGALLALCTCAAVGLTFASRGWQRGAWMICALVSMSGVVLTASRGAIVALVCALFGLVAHLVWRKLRTRKLHARKQHEPDQQDDSPKQGKPWLGLAVLPLLLGVGLFTQLAWRQRLSWELRTGGSLEEISAEVKVQVIETAVSMIPDFWLVGAGADSFAVVAPLYLGDLITARFSFVECDPVQILLDFGLVGGGAAMLLVAWSWRNIVMWRPSETTSKNKHLRSPASMGLLWGIVAWCVSALVSFNVEILGLALPVALSAQVLLARRKREGLVRLPARAGLVVVSVGVVLVAVTGWLHHSWSAQQDTLVQWLVQGQTPEAKPLLRVLTGVMQRSPTDGDMLGRGVLLWQRQQPGHEAILPLATRATVLAPHSAVPSLGRARAAVHAQKWEEASESYKHALARLKPVPGRLVREVWRALPTPVAIARALPSRTDVLGAVVQDMIREKQANRALDVTMELLALYPEHADVHRFVVVAALASDQGLMAQMFAEQMIGAFPAQPQSYLTMARAHLAQKRPLDALAILSRGVERLPEDVSLRLRRAGILSNLPLSAAPAEAAEVLRGDLDFLRVRTLGNKVWRAQYFYLSGLRWERQGEAARAALDFRRASKLQPGAKVYQRKVKDL